MIETVHVHIFKAQPELRPGMNMNPEYQKFKMRNQNSAGGRVCLKRIEVCHNYFCNSVNPVIIVSDFPAGKFMGI